MRIPEILNELARESGTNRKMDILRKYVDNPTLKRVLYLANSKRIKFYIRQIPSYTFTSNIITLDKALDELGLLSNRGVTGGAASNYLESILSHLNPDEAKVIEKIIDKDLRIGVGTRNINKVFPKLIEKTPYMGATSYSVKKIKDLLEKGPVFSQVKMDGRYCNSIIYETDASSPNHDVYLESRSGEANPLAGAKFMDELSKFHAGYVFNGELTIDGILRHVSNGIIQSLVDIMKKKELRSKEEHAKHVTRFENQNNMTLAEGLNSIVFTVWDAVTVDEYFDGKSIRPYHERLEFVKHSILDAVIDFKCSQVRTVESKILTTYREVVEDFQEKLNAGEEGTVVKSLDGEWKDGKPKWQVKMKLELDLDLVIVGFNYGTGKNSEVISSLTCETSNGLLKTKPTGINEKIMQYITDHQDELMGTIVEIKCSGLSQDRQGNYSVLHPVFKKFRDDKHTANSLNDAIEIEEMAKGLS